MLKARNWVGYQHLREMFDLKTPPHFRRTAVAEQWRHVVTKTGATEDHILPLSYDPGNETLDHIEFALKYEGLDLALFSALFEKITAAEIEVMIRSKPNGQYSRRLWFLYERLTKRSLNIPDAKSGNYIPLADPELYFTIPSTRLPRYRINLNIPMHVSFCPLVRRSEKLLEYQRLNLSERAKQTVKECSPELFARAINYLYTKETKASFLIEKEEPDINRSERFIVLLKQAEKTDFLEKRSLLQLQNIIVDPRFKADDYRDFQNYVGESYGFGQEKIHFICPKPEDVADLMEGLLDVAKVLSSSEIDPVIKAAIIAFGFVFIHPFEDGNGRIHRFIIHNILSRSNFSPEGLIFPVSAAMLGQMRKYDETLESFSVPLLDKITYHLSDDGEMTVQSNTKSFYSFIDFTFIAEQLYDFIHDTVIKQLPAELAFLTRYDAAKKALKNVADIPDRLIDLFIKVCRENNGSLSKSKRDGAFAKLSDNEIERMEEAYKTAMKD